MKILNWVRGRLNRPISSVSLHPQKGHHEVKMNNQEVDTKERSMSTLSALDREEPLLGWGDGILAIGTLGFHAPHPDFIVNPRFSFRNSSTSVFDPRDSVIDDQEYYLDTPYTHIEEMMAGENDENPLVFNAYNYHEIEEAKHEKITLGHLEQVKAADLHDISSHSIKSDRTTLADLFKADQNESVNIKKWSEKWGSALKDGINKESTQIMSKQKKLIQRSLSAKLVQKLIPSHEVQPIKKINHIMRMATKRKIHPAEQLPRQKSTSKTENQGMMPLPSKDEVQVNEVMALLQSGTSNSLS